MNNNNNNIMLNSVKFTTTFRFLAREEYSEIPRGRRWDFAVEHECSHLAGSSLVNLGGVRFKNVREWNDSAPDSKNRMAPLRV
jgi:hypothetical protein